MPSVVTGGDCCAPSSVAAIFTISASDAVPDRSSAVTASPARFIGNVECVMDASSTLARFERGAATTLQVPSGRQTKSARPASRPTEIIRPTKEKGAVAPPLSQSDLLQIVT
ncbi:hypothetical protein [Mesorhizobium sp. J428]|uniref:hypothetical protein n=1 Tax=Mesorhizobium sp. J428 TaxID=2898440 RepID=UPI00215146FE|nr:hypothetical protein [Mesorhizobium sp. J428]MCR5855395.1 hypothetical protein [Mesorhizobium sp. J428]